ncbi:MAG: DNA repair exonuclease [Clostridia bacterium]|nr:DNA repair exonuclease [Clostridia bacterium]
MSTMRLIHCADLHLGAKMTANLDAKRAKERRDELLLTFGDIVATAARMEARAVLIAGDLFDTSRVTVSTRRHVGQLITDYADICFIYVSGNHDRDVQPLFPEDRLPQNWVDLSGEVWTSVTLSWDGLPITISGTSGTEHAEIYECVPAAPGYHIVMLHGEVTPSASVGRDVVSLSRLSGKGIDYLALGHEHSYRAETLDARGIWCYSGCPEGRGFDECGEKGIVVLELNKDLSSPTGVSMQQRFLPIARRTVHRLQVDACDCDNDRALWRCIESAAGDIPREDMLLLTLVGEISAELYVDSESLERRLSEHFFAVKVDNRTTLALHAEDYLHDISLKGEFIRTVMASKLSPTERDRVILCGLRALRGEEAEL